MNAMVNPVNPTAKLAAAMPGRMLVIGAALIVLIPVLASLF